jgi:hypothetical protein
MKNIALLLLISFFSFSNVNAQYASIGAKAGGGFTKAHGDDASSDLTNQLFGFHGGFVGSYSFISKLAIQTELLYEQKGFTYDGYPINQDELLADDHRLHYVTLPVMLKVQGSGLFAEAGPYLGLLVAENTKVKRVEQSSFNGPNPVILGDYPLSLDDFNRWDYGYTIGVGIQLESGLTASVHNSGGFTSFSKELDQKNFGFKFSVGYFLKPWLP